MVVLSVIGKTREKIHPIVPKIDGIINCNPRPAAKFFAQTARDKRPLVGVEIGVSKGFNAVATMKLVGFDKFYLVDPYEKYFDQGAYHDDGVRFYGPNERIAHKLLDNFSGASFVRETSVEAAKVVPGKVDWCYIDGNHSYEYVIADIEAWLPKIKKGGVLAGHDFYGNYPGVLRAVVEKFGWDGIKSGNTDWWIVKQE